MVGKELLVLDHIYSHPEASQRDIALSTGISLGQTNQIIRLLCQCGQLRQDVITKKKIKYTLTQRGLAERARLFNENVLTAIRKYKKIKDSVKNLLTNLYDKGCREFVLEGERGEIHDVITEVFEKHFLDKANLIWGPSDGKPDQIVINLDRRILMDKNVVNVLHEIVA